MTTQDAASKVILFTMFLFVSNLMKMGFAIANPIDFIGNVAAAKSYNFLVIQHSSFTTVCRT
jgi:type IV secretory pathway VirB3-like protein